MTTAARLLALLLCLVAPMAMASTITGVSNFQGGTFGSSAVTECPLGDYCDDFSTDTITSGDWAGQDLGTWSVTGGVAQNVYAASNGISRLRNVSDVLPADNCQVVYLSGTTGDTAGGIILRATGTTYATSNHLEILLAEDKDPQSFDLRSYENTTDVLEATVLYSVPIPGWWGACIEGDVVSLFTFDSKPNDDPTTWTDEFIGTLQHDGTPAVATNFANGLRNYRESGTGPYQVASWAGFTTVYTAPASMALSGATFPRSAAEGGSAANITVNVLNEGGGTFDWDRTIGANGDCNGGTAGGTSWITSATPASGTGLASGSPDQITVVFDISECLEGGPYTTDITVVGSNPTPANDTLVATISLTITAAGGGGTAPNEGDFTTVLTYTGTPAASTINSDISGATAGSILVKTTDGQARAVVSGEISTSRDDVTFYRMEWSGDWTGNLTGDNLTLWDIVGDPFRLGGMQDGMVIRDSYFSGGAGDTSSSCTGNLYQQFIEAGTADNTAYDGVLIENNTFVNYLNAQGTCAGGHSEALYIGPGRNLTVRGNTFDNNGSTAHIFVTWWSCGGSYAGTQCDPINLCIEDNTFTNVFNVFGTDMQVRAELSASATAYIDPAQDYTGTEHSQNPGGAWSRVCP